MLPGRRGGGDADWRATRPPRRRGRLRPPKEGPWGAVVKGRSSAGVQGRSGRTRRSARGMVAGGGERRRGARERGASEARSLRRRRAAGGRSQRRGEREVGPRLTWPKMAFPPRRQLVAWMGIINSARISGNKCGVSN